MTRASISKTSLAALVLLALTGGPGVAQSSGRTATTVAALRASPVFFHSKQIAVMGAVTESRDLVRLDPPSADGANATAKPPSNIELASPGSIYIFWRERPSRQSGEIRGEFWDLGRLTENDPRFSSYNFRALLDAVSRGQWPSRDQIFVLIGATITEPTLPETASLRALALAPEKYQDRSVTVSGRFRGRNLYGDLPSPLTAPSKWDFVIQSADSAIWVSELRPKGKNFELDPTARVDTGRWVEISGTLHREGSRSWIVGREIALSAPPQTTEVEVALPATPAEPPPTVVFTAPVADEPDVEPTVIVRVQFSRDMDGRSFKDHIRVGYLPPAQGTAPPAGSPPAAALAPPVFTSTYNVGNRGVELKFTKPLERFQIVKIELIDGIKALGGDPLPPWAMTFTTGR